MDTQADGCEIPPTKFAGGGGGGEGGGYNYSAGQGLSHFQQYFNNMRKTHV